MSTKRGGKNHVSSLDYDTLSNITRCTLKKRVCQSMFAWMSFLKNEIMKKERKKKGRG